ncbi:MAG TPA: glycosyltransferase family 4 protein [Thermoanaerobaculia bacterium]|nr:glycosyltransferase family 4 protein [Thermoanaerobaculia bacterium]
MKIWLINPYGTLPGEGWRDWRFTMLADALAKRGHDVTWWTAGYDHYSRRTRTKTWETRQIDGYRVKLVPTPEYHRNISIGRFRFEILFATRMLRAARAEAPPDVIVGEDPPQTAGLASIVLGRRVKRPVILDIIDLWPEVYAGALPSKLRWLAPVVFAPFYWLRRYNFSRATGIVGACESYLDVALRAAPKADRANTETVYFGLDSSELAHAEEAPLPEKKLGQFWAVYAGSLGANYDVKTLIAAAKLVAPHDVQVVVAGDGPMRDVVRDAAGGNLHFLGRLPTTQLPSLYARGDVGLVPYAGWSTVAMPVKSFDYLAAGLPMISSLGRELRALMEREGFGMSYRGGDAQSLADAILTLARDRTRRDAMAANARRLSQLFERSVQYARFVDLIERIGARQGSR